MPYIIGTAGHIDHGKTSLIKALTGTDTDRLKEEKERGISIDLGFAHLDLPDGTSAGIVDVPGHERFIKNMLAGAHGIDLVLFTVAADDGVMPQTEEHLDIVHLLGVKMAIFVITKADLVSARAHRRGRRRDRHPHPRHDVGKFAQARRFLRHRPRCRRAKSSCISKTLKIPYPGRAERLFPPAGRPRFRLQGHGVVVTGTALSGEIKVGEQVRCLPGDHLFRVRSLQVHGKSVDTRGLGPAGRDESHRSGARLIERGQVICHEKLSLTIGALRRFSRSAAGGGARASKTISECACISARPSGSAKSSSSAQRRKSKPKQSAYCQVMLNEPLLALRGDHFIVRDETAQRTLAGGLVINPWAKRHKRGDRELAGRLEALHRGDLATLTQAFIDSQRIVRRADRRDSSVSQRQGRNSCAKP